jgi:hypothetical protein
VSLTIGSSVQHGRDMNECVTQRRSLEEIVEEIMVVLGNGRDLILSEAETRKILHRDIPLKRALVHVPELSLRDALDAIECEAKGVAESLGDLLSKMNDLSPASWLVRVLFGSGEHFEDDEDAAEARKAFTQQLERMLAQCQREVQHAQQKRRGLPRLRQRPDRVKNYCAGSAFNYMKILTRQPITGTAEGPYRVFTSLLYEGVTGKAELDLKRACDRQLRSVSTPSATLRGTGSDARRG